jgi:hypothetical protein
VKELLYDTDSALIAAVLFVSVAAAIEIGLRVGRRLSVPANEAVKEHINGIQAAMLGILALRLGFTFSLARQRYDSRSEAVVDEANAIGTARLRTQLLPATLRGEAQALLRNYSGARVQASTLTLADHAQLGALMAARRSSRRPGGRWRGVRSNSTRTRTRRSCSSSRSTRSSTASASATRPCSATCRSSC